MVAGRIVYNSIGYRSTDAQYMCVVSCIELYTAITVPRASLIVQHVLKASSTALRAAVT